MKKINKLIFAAFLLCLTITAAFAQRTPTFGQYAAKVEKAKAREVNLKSHKNARMYRTNLRNAFKEGVNFAGHYMLATWGCGTSCTESGIVDARTGGVYFPAELQGASLGFCEMPDDAEQFVFKPGSRLLVLNGFKGSDVDNQKASCGVYYFEWTGTKLRQVKFVKKNRLEMPQ